MTLPPQGLHHPLDHSDDRRRTHFPFQDAPDSVFVRVRQALNINNTG